MTEEGSNPLTNTEWVYLDQWLENGFTGGQGYIFWLKNNYSIGQH